MPTCEDAPVDALTEEDYESVHHAGRVLHERGWRQVFTVNQMTAAWAQLVDEIETGYDQLVDEYTNDLSCRDWLAAAWPMLTERVRVARHAELRAIDARFLAATVEDTERALGRFRRIDATDGWWWRRLPIRRDGDFGRDLG